MHSLDVQLNSTTGHFCLHLLQLRPVSHPLRVLSGKVVNRLSVQFTLYTPPTPKQTSALRLLTTTIQTEQPVCSSSSSATSFLLILLLRPCLLKRGASEHWVTLRHSSQLFQIATHPLSLTAGNIWNKYHNSIYAQLGTR